MNAERRGQGGGSKGMKKAFYVIWVFLLICFNINEAKSELLSPELSVSQLEINYHDFSFDYKLQAPIQNISCTGGKLRWAFTFSELIQTKSSASLNFTSEGYNIPLSIKAINGKQQDGVYKYDVELVYDGEALGLMNFKGLSLISIKQDNNDTYQSATSRFLISFTQEHMFTVQVMSYDETKGSVFCFRENGELNMLQGSIGYMLSDQKGDDSKLTFRFSPKAGFHVKDVKVNGDSQGAIRSYVTDASQHRNYLIEVIFEKDTEEPYIKILYKEDRGTIKVNDAVVANGQKVHVEKGGSVSVTVIPKQGHCRGWVKLTPLREITTMTLNAHRGDPVTYVFDDYVENMTFDYLFYKLYDAKIRVIGNGSVKIDGYTVYEDPEKSIIQLRYMEGIEMEFFGRDDYHLKQVLIDGVDRTNEVSENKLVLSDPPKDIKVEYAKTLSVSVSYNEGGTVMVNDKSVIAGNSVTVFASTDVKVAITPNNGYHIKQVKLGSTDVTSQVRDNLLTITSISENTNITVVFEKNAPVTYTVKVTYSEGGTVKINDKVATSGSTVNVSVSTNVIILIIPSSGYHVKSVTLGNEDVTSLLKENKITITSISENANITVIFEKDAPVTYTVKATYSKGGTVKINDQLVTSEKSLSVTALSDVKVMIIPDKGYHLESIKLGDTNVTNQVKDNVITIPTISTNKEITVIFEKDIYIVKVTYSEGGDVKLNDQNVTSGNSISMDALTDLKVLIIPNNGYHLKQVKVGATDVTDQVANNLLTIPAILENKEITVTFEKNAPTSYTFQVNVSGNGKVKVDGKTIENGSSVTVSVTGTKLEFLPDNQYRVAKVLLGSKDITKEIVDNVYNVPSVSSDVSLSVTFEKIPTYKLSINMTGGTGSIKIGDKTVTQSEQISDLQRGTLLGLNFLPDKYYEVKRVVLGGSDITSQIQNGYYEIQSIESDLMLSIEYQRKSYTLTLSTIQGIEKICVNQKEYKDVTQIMLLSGETTISVYSNELYYIKQILLSGKVIYDDKSGISVHTGNIKIDVDGDKDLTVILTLREKRKLSIKVTEPGTLASLLSEEDNRLVTHLVVEGKIDQRDFEVMNQMQSLSVLYLPKSVEAIGNQSFAGSVVSRFLSPYTGIYEHLMKIGEEAFKNCSYLIHGPLSESVELIEESAFEGCSNMYGIGVLSSVKEIKSSAFKNCVKCTIQFNSGVETACLEKVGDYAFENVKTVYFDDAEKLSYIGYQALKGCQNTSFNFSDCLSLTELPSFENCSEMQSIVFPPNVKRVYSNSFIGCSSLQTVHMGDISVIEEFAFKDCPAIDYVYLSAEEIPQVSENSFCNSVYQIARLFVPANRLQFYKEDAVWGKFENIRTIGLATKYRLELLLSEGGTVGVRQDEEDWEYYYYGYLNIVETSRVYFHVRPEQGFMIESVVLNDKDITNTLDENKQFVIPYLMENTYLDIKFKKEDDPTSIDQVPNAIKRVYRSAPRRLVLSGFKAGALVYVYDGSGRLVVLKTIRDSVEEVDVPADGLYFVRIGKESFKVVL